MTEQSNKMGLDLSLIYNTAEAYNFKGQSVYQGSELWATNCFVVMQDDDSRFARYKSMDLVYIEDDHPIVREAKKAMDRDMVPVLFTELVKDNDSEKVLVRFSSDNASMWLDASLVKTVLRKSRGNFSWAKSNLAATEFGMVKFSGGQALAIMQHGEVKSFVAQMLIEDWTELKGLRDDLHVIYNPNPEQPDMTTEELRQYVEAQKAQRLQSYRHMLAEQKARNTFVSSLMQSISKAASMLALPAPEQPAEQPQSLPAEYAMAMQPEPMAFEQPEEIQSPRALAAPHPILVEIEQAEPGTPFEFVRADLDMTVTIMPYFGEIEVYDENDNLIDVILAQHPSLFYLKGSDLEDEGSYVIEDMGMVVYDLIHNGFTFKPAAPAKHYDEELMPVEEPEETEPELLLIA